MTPAGTCAMPCPMPGRWPRCWKKLSRSRASSKVWSRCPCWPRRAARRKPDGHRKHGHQAKRAQRVVHPGRPRGESQGARTGAGCERLAQGAAGGPGADHVQHAWLQRGRRPVLPVPLRYRPSRASGGQGVAPACHFDGRAVVVAAGRRCGRDGHDRGCLFLVGQRRAGRVQAGPDGEPRTGATGL